EPRMPTDGSADCRIPFPIRFDPQIQRKSQLFFPHSCFNQERKMMHLHRSFPRMARKKTSSSNGFAERLKSLRKQRNLSQTELGQLVDVHYTHIGRDERGSSRPAADTLNRLAQALGVSG